MKWLDRRSLVRGRRRSDDDACDPAAVAVDADDPASMRDRRRRALDVGANASHIMPGPEPRVVELLDERLDGRRLPAVARSMLSDGASAATGP